MEDCNDFRMRRAPQLQHLYPTISGSKKSEVGRFGWTIRCECDALESLKRAATLVVVQSFDLRSVFYILPIIGSCRVCRNANGIVGSGFWICSRLNRWVLTVVGGRVREEIASLYGPFVCFTLIQGSYANQVISIQSSIAFDKEGLG